MRTMPMQSDTSDGFWMRSTCRSAFTPRWAISRQPSLRANGGSNIHRGLIFTNEWQNSVQSHGGSTTITAFQAAYAMHKQGWEVLYLVDPHRPVDELI